MLLVDLCLRNEHSVMHKHYCRLFPSTVSSTLLSYCMCLSLLLVVCMCAPSLNTFSHVDPHFKVTGDPVIHINVILCPDWLCPRSKAHGRGRVVPKQPPTPTATEISLSTAALCSVVPCPPGMESRTHITMGLCVGLTCMFYI